MGHFDWPITQKILKLWILKPTPCNQYQPDYQGGYLITNSYAQQ